MSDREIFYIGLFATVLLVIHLYVNISQFRKLEKQSRKLEKMKPEDR